MMSFGTWPRTERHWILDTRGGHLPPLPFQIVPAFRFQSEGHAVQVPSQEGSCGGEAGWNAVVELTQFRDQRQRAERLAFGRRRARRNGHRERKDVSIEVTYPEDGGQFLGAETDWPVLSPEPNATA